MIADFHNDILTVKSLYDKYLKGLDCGILALYKGEHTCDYIFKIAENYKGKHKIAFEEISNITDDELEKLISFSPVYVTLTWNFENDLAHGSFSDGGIKKRGKTIVKKLTENGIYIDTAHLCKRSFLDVISLSDKIVNSHTCFSAVNYHKRNIDDEQISLLNSIGAQIGITFVGAFLTHGIATSDNVIRHIEHYVQKYGTKGLCIGSDFFGTTDLPIDIKSYTDFKIIIEKLYKLGYSETDINSILYDNLYKQIFKPAKDF